MKKVILHEDPEFTGKYRIPPIRIGDGVATVAQPIAHAADALLGTRISDCGECPKRQEKLNELGEKLSDKINQALEWLG